MEGVGARLGRSSTRYGPTTVFTGPVRRWKKKWVHVSPSSISNSSSANHTTSNGANNNASHLLLYKWSPISQNNNKDEAAATPPDEIPRKKFKYIPVDVEMTRADEDAAKLQELDEMKKRLKEMEEEAAALREMQAKVEKEMGAVQDPTNAAATQANREEVDSRSVFVGNAWSDRVKQCVSVKSQAMVEIDVLHKLKLQMTELHVQLPEMKQLLELLDQVAIWEVRCTELMKGPIHLKELEIVLKDADSFIVNIPELKLLRQHHCAAVSWISRFHEVQVNSKESEDQESIARELSCILKDGQMLRVQVDELALAELELKKASCRAKALKARRSLMPFDYIQQLMSEANVLELENEKLFVDMSGVLAAAISWEERARGVLGTVVTMSDLEDVLRSSEKLFLILPSLHDVKDVLISAKSWLRRSQQFLGGKSLNSLLNLDALKEVIAQAKLLRVSLEEPDILEGILKECEAWKLDAQALLGCVKSLFDLSDIDSSVKEGLVDAERISHLLDRSQNATNAGLSLGFDFPEISELQKTSSRLEWCLNAVSFSSKIPLLEEVEKLIQDVTCLSSGSLCSNLESLLISGVRWLQKALKLFPKSDMQKRPALTDVKKILEDAQSMKLSFPLVVSQLVSSVDKHKSWTS